MPKTHEMMESKYLRKEDVGDGALYTVAKLEKANVAMQGQPPEEKWILHFEESEKGMVLNSTNIQLCEAAFGSDDTDDWIGKRVVLYTDPNVSFGGKIVGGIRVRAPRGKHANIQPPKVGTAPKGGGKFDDLADDIPY